MSQSVSTFKDDITPKLHGTSLAKVTGVYAKMRQAAAKMRAKVKPRSIVRRARIEGAIYDMVYNYTCPSWLDVDSIIDLRPVAERSNQDEVIGGYIREFDIEKADNKVLVEYINGAKTLRVSKEVGDRSVLHRMDSATVDGTITLGGDASNAAIQTLDYIAGSGSYQFDLDGSTGTATVTIALDNEIDLSDMNDVGSLLYWLKFPDVSRLTSVELKWGESATIYWTKTETAAHDRSFTEAGDSAWMLMRHDWVDATETGSPDEDTSEAIDYLQITITYSTGTALTNVRLDNIVAVNGAAYEVLGYSNSFFTDSTGATWKATPTLDSDLIQLDDIGYQIFLNEFMLTCQQEIKGKDMKIDFAFFKDENGSIGDERIPASGLYAAFAESNPNEALVRQAEYYTFDDLSGR